MSRESFYKAVDTSFRNKGSYGFSFFSFPGMDAPGIAAEVAVVRDETGNRLMPNPSMRHAMCADVRALGYPLAPDNDPRGHVTLTFDARPADEDWEALMSVFSDPPEPNPIALP